MRIFWGFFLLGQVTFGRCISIYQNTVADSLGLYPPVDKGNLNNSTQVCTVDEVKATFDGAVIQSNDDETWVPFVSHIFTNMWEVESYLQDTDQRKIDDSLI